MILRFNFCLRDIYLTSEYRPAVHVGACYGYLIAGGGVHFIPYLIPGGIIR